MSYKDIMGVIPTIQSTSLLGHNIRQLKKKQTARRMIRTATTNIVGASMIKETSNVIKGL